MELKITNRITNRITNKINRLKWKVDLYKFKFNMWKMCFRLDTLNIRIALNPKIIKLKLEGKLHQMGWKLYRTKIKFNKLRRKINLKERIVVKSKALGEALFILLVMYFMAFMFDFTLLSIAHCFGFMTDFKIF